MTTAAGIAGRSLLVAASYVVLRRGDKRYKSPLKLDIPAVLAAQSPPTAHAAFAIKAKFIEVGLKNERVSVDGSVIFAGTIHDVSGKEVVRSVKSQRPRSELTPLSIRSRALSWSSI